MPSKPVLESHKNSPAAVHRPILICVRNAAAILGTVALAMIGLVIAWEIWPGTEPSCRGKRLSAWLAQLDDHKAQKGVTWSAEPDIQLNSTQQEAAEAVHEIGTNALPRLLTMIRTEDPHYPPVLRSLLDRRFRKPPYYGRESRASRTRRQAALAFVALGPSAKPALPELSRLFWYPSSECTKDVALALAGIGPDGAAPLKTALTNKNSWAATTAIWALGQFPTNAQFIIPDLLEGVTNKNFGFRLGSLNAFCLVHPPPEVGVPALIACVTNPDSTVRQLSLRALRSYGPQATSAVPFLLERLRLRDPPPSLIKDALREIDPKAAGAAGLN